MTTEPGLPRALRSPELGTRCALDLLAYFYRHPSTYVTMDALALRVGHPAAAVEAGIDALTRAGVIVQHRHATLGAVMCRLLLPRLPPGAASSAFATRWRRQTLLIAKARERCRRAAMRATRSEERLARTNVLLTALGRHRHFPRDG